MGEMGYGDLPPENQTELESSRRFQDKLLLILGEILGERLFGEEGFAKLKEKEQTSIEAGVEFTKLESSADIEYEQYKRLAELIDKASEDLELRPEDEEGFKDEYRKFIAAFEETFKITVNPEEIAEAKELTLVALEEEISGYEDEE